MSRPPTPPRNGLVISYEIYLSLTCHGVTYVHCDNTLRLLGCPSMMSKMCGVNCALGKVSSQMHNATQKNNAIQYARYSIHVLNVKSYAIKSNQYVQWANIPFNES